MYWIPDDYGPPERSARQIALRSRRSAREGQLLRYATPAHAGQARARNEAAGGRATPLARLSLLIGRARG
jgi:hypothetical protein